MRQQIRKHFILPGFTLSLQEEEEIPKEFFMQFKEKFKQQEEKKKNESFWLAHQKELEGKIFSTLISKVEKNKIEVSSPWGIETILLQDFDWAVPVEDKQKEASLTDARKIFKTHDIISVRVKSNSTSKTKTSPSSMTLELYQKPLVEGALLSFDLENAQIIALVGGYDYSRSEYNRAYQSRRQSGSVFKPFVYGAALEKGFHPGTLISDSPIVFSKEEAEEKSSDTKTKEQEEENPTQDMWRPANITDRFLGDIPFRKGLVRSLNVPTVRIMEKIGLQWVRFYVRRLGIFSPLNSDFTMALGSSSLTLYETLKAFSVFATQGQGLKPLLIERVEDLKGKIILQSLSLDEVFKKDIEKTELFVEQNKSRWFKQKNNNQTAFQKRWHEVFNNSTHLIPPSSSFVLMNLLEAVITDSEGTAGRARSLNRPLGGKTGTTDGYYDTWFVGSSPFISAAVWIGFDSEKSLGKGETGSRTALPVWMQYIKESHKDLPKMEFPVPDGVVFANIDAETGSLVTAESKEIIHQAFIKGSEPKWTSNDEQHIINKDELLIKDPALNDDETDFIKEDLSH